MVKDHEPNELLVWLSSRTLALTVYGSMGTEVGLAILTTGGPTTLEDRFGIWSRLVIGLLSLIGGLATLLGVVVGDRTRKGWTATLIGTCLMALWAVAVGTGYFFATLDAGVSFSMPWHPVAHHYARLYIPLFYQSVLFLILLHVVTLVRLGRPPRR